MDQRSSDMPGWPAAAVLARNAGRAVGDRRPPPSINDYARAGASGDDPRQPAWAGDR